MLVALARGPEGPGAILLVMAAMIGGYMALNIGANDVANLSGSRAELEALSEMDKPVDDLHRAILDYLGEVSKSRLSEDQSRDLMQIVSVANDLEHIADVIGSHMVTSTRKRMDEVTHISPDTAKRLSVFSAR